MKLIAKVFLCVTLVVSLALSVLGYLLIERSFDAAVQRESAQMVSQYRFVCFVVQSQAISNGAKWKEESFFSRLERTTNGYVAVYADGVPVFSNFPSGTALESAQEEETTYRIVPQGDEYFLIVSGSFSQMGETVSVHTAGNVTSIVASVQQMQKSYRRIYAVAWSASALFLLLLTRALTRPIVSLARSTQAIAAGDYTQRVRVGSTDEIGLLARNFNRMAEQIERNVEQLEQSVQQKERFVANFAHELKTPLTSVIGYADMIYQRDMPREDTRAAASYILGEGLRLEALSLKLMDMIVLDKQDFVLEWLDVQELFSNIADTLAPLCQRKGVDLRLSIDEGFVKVEFDLFKTMILNLVDNSVKAGAQRIVLIARRDGQKMGVHVLDDGMGIKKEELAKITEAFYMVDKSRARKQHGAGLGLALCERIAKVHGSEFTITSAYEEGSCAHVSLLYRREP